MILTAFLSCVTDGTKAGAGTNTAQVSTYSLDSAYDDAPTTIELIEDPANSGIFVSKSQLLVSDDDDDDYDSFDIIPADESYNDRTHKIALEGLVQAKYFRNGTELCRSTADVPVFGSVHLTPIILRDKPQADGGAPVVSIADAEARLTVANERYAQIGIELTWSTPLVCDPPTGVDLDDGLAVIASGQSQSIAVEAMAVVDNLGTTGDTSDIHLFFVNDVISETSSVNGVALADYWLQGNQNAYLDNFFVKAGLPVKKGGITIAHELGHLLTNYAHQDYTWMLMYHYYTGSGVSE